MVLTVNAQSAAPKPFTYESQVQLPTPRAASIVAAAVDVDPELRPTQIVRQIRVDGSTISILISANDPKMLRNSAVSLYDFIRVSLSAVSQFSSESSD